ncbi:MAG: NmrA family NAD(P)-binding protein [Rhodospirillales bacterium]|nr:NmrA family NAD(P)-binding protein [Acetobacter sp.]
MHIVLGATGHVGSAVAQTLLDQDEAVTTVTHDPQKACAWQDKGAQAAVLDVHDTEALRRVFRSGRRLFLLNPPAPPSTDTAAEERRSLASILAALKDSGLEKIVAQSTYGAQPGGQVGDLGVLYEMEQVLAAQAIPATIIRGAYYMSNWEAALSTAREQGRVNAFYPPDFKLPMVAPEDIGQLAARLLTEPAERTGLYFIEGPGRYSPTDVATAFAATLGTPVEAAETPRGQWRQALRAMGFAEPAAESFAKMTAATLEGASQWPEDPVRGETTLTEYIQAMVRRQSTNQG